MNENRMKKLSLLMGILLLITTLGCIGSQSSSEQKTKSYDAIDLVPERIEGFDTLIRKVDVHEKRGDEGCFSTAASSAAALYYKDGINWSIAVFECELEDEANKTITEYSKGHEIVDIELEKGIRANRFGIWHDDFAADGTYTQKMLVVIVWQEENFISNMWAIVLDEDSIDTGKHLAKSITLQSPL